jgi:glucosamine 6-phosphate synthetase-like amidotransferase/phosphosugar isomerase protein
MSHANALLDDTGLWKDALELPESLTATLDAADGFRDVADLLSHRSVRRIVVTGNGASYYVALNLWLASIMNSASADTPDVMAIPIGLIATGHFSWRRGDVMLAISSSGEFRDVVAAVLDEAAPTLRAAITSKPDSTVGTNAQARALVSVLSERAATHTQAYCGAVAASLAIWARLASDRNLATSLHRSIDQYNASFSAALHWAAQAFRETETPAAGISFGSGPALAAALEAALLMREVARIPWEGEETREGATTAMYALRHGHLVLSVGSSNDLLLAEAEEACSRSGAKVLRTPGGEGDVRLAAINTFPAALRAAIVLGTRGGHDVDSPAWLDGYYATSRQVGR